MKASRAHKILLGIFTVETAALIVVVLLIWGGMRFWTRSDGYEVDVVGSAIGIEGGSPVMLNGVSVGKVASIEIAPHDLGRVLVHIQVKPGTPIRADTRAVTVMSGITGLRAIDLREGSYQAPALPPGEIIPSQKGG